MTPPPPPNPGNNCFFGQIQLRIIGPPKKDCLICVIFHVFPGKSSFCQLLANISRDPHILGNFTEFYNFYKNLQILQMFYNKGKCWINSKICRQPMDFPIFPSRHTKLTPPPLSNPENNGFFGQIELRIIGRQKKDCLIYVIPHVFPRKSSFWAHFLWFAVR